jgi:hypothetical protein
MPTYGFSHGGYRKLSHVTVQNNHRLSLRIHDFD